MKDKNNKTIQDAVEEFSRLLDTGIKHGGFLCNDNDFPIREKHQVAWLAKTLTLIDKQAREEERRRGDLY